MSDPTFLDRPRDEARTRAVAHWQPLLERALVDGSTPEPERLEIIERLHGAIARGDEVALELTMDALRAVASRATVAAQACALIRTATQKIKASLDAPRPVLVAGGGPQWQ